MRPSLGRIVHFYDRRGGRPFMATVTGSLAEECGVSSPMHANLRVDWDGTRDTYDDGWMPNVAYSETPTPGEDRWCWPPRV